MQCTLQFRLGMKILTLSTTLLRITKVRNNRHLNKIQQPSAESHPHRWRVFRTKIAYLPPNKTIYSRDHRPWGIFSLCWIDSRTNSPPSVPFKKATIKDWWMQSLNFFSKNQPPVKTKMTSGRSARTRWWPLGAALWKASIVRRLQSGHRKLKPMKIVIKTNRSLKVKMSAQINACNNNN